MVRIRRPYVEISWPDILALYNALEWPLIRAQDHQSIQEEQHHIDVVQRKLREIRDAIRMRRKARWAQLVPRCRHGRPVHQTCQRCKRVVR